MLSVLGVLEEIYALSSSWKACFRLSRVEMVGLGRRRMGLRSLTEESDNTSDSCQSVIDVVIVVKTHIQTRLPLHNPLHV